jgi:hypothetical protein
VSTDNTGAFRFPGLSRARYRYSSPTTATRRPPSARPSHPTRYWNITLLSEDSSVDTTAVGETVRSSVSADDPHCGTADPTVEELNAPCKTFQFTAPRSGTLTANLTWSSTDVFMELLTPWLGECSRPPLQLQFSLIAGVTYTVSAGFHRTNGAGPRGTAVFELTTSLAP